MLRIKKNLSNEAARMESWARWNSIAKPLHSLGLLEDMIVKIAGIHQTADVHIDKRCAAAGMREYAKGSVK